MSEKSLQVRHDMQSSERAGNANAQKSARLCVEMGRGVSGRLEIRENALDIFVKRRACVGQMYLFDRTIEQRDT